MKQFVAIVAGLAILLQSLNQVVIVASFYAQKDYIARNLCENRDKPQMHCEGKCCLKKKLAKDSQNQAPGPRSQKSPEVVTLFFTNPSIAIHAPLFFSVPDVHIPFNELGTISFPRSVFHPPAA